MNKYNRNISTILIDFLCIKNQFILIKCLIKNRIIKLSSIKQLNAIFIAGNIYTYQIKA